MGVPQSSPLTPSLPPQLEEMAEGRSRLAWLPPTLEENVPYCRTQEKLRGAVGTDWLQSFCLASLLPSDFLVSLLVVL